MKIITTKSIVLLENYLVYIDIAFFKKSKNGEYLNKFTYTIEPPRQVDSILNHITSCGEIPFGLKDILNTATESFYKEFPDVSDKDLMECYRIRIILKFIHPNIDSKIYSWVTDDYMKYLKELCKNYKYLIVPELLSGIIYDIENNSILEATFEIHTTDMDCHENYINFKDHGKTEYGVKVGDIIINKTTRERFRVEQVPDYHGIYWQSEYKLSLVEDYTSSYRSLSEDFILRIWDE